MHVPLDDPKALGHLVRQIRKGQRLRQDDLAGMAGTSHVFVRDVERGKATIQVGKLLDVLRELGIHLIADIPESPPRDPNASRKKQVG